MRVNKFSSADKAFTKHMNMSSSQRNSSSGRALASRIRGMVKGKEKAFITHMNRSTGAMMNRNASKGGGGQRGNPNHGADGRFV